MDQIGNITAVVVALIAAIGSLASTVLTIKYGRKTDETHAVTTINHHTSEQPTIPDRLDNIEQAQAMTLDALNKHIKEHQQ